MWVKAGAEENLNKKLNGIVIYRRIGNVYNGFVPRFFVQGMSPLRKGRMDMADSYHYHDDQNDPGRQKYSNQNCQGGSGYRYDYGYQPGAGPMGPKRPGKNQNGWGEWIGMGVLALIPSLVTKVIAFLWFVRKLGSMSRSEKEAYRQEARRAVRQMRDTVINVGDDLFQGGNKSAGHGRHWQSQQGGPGAWETGSGVKGEQNAHKSTKEWDESWNIRGKQGWTQKQRRKAASGGTELIIGGGIMTGIFGSAFFPVLIEFLDELMEGEFPADELAGLLVVGIFLAGGVVMLASGISQKHRGERYVNYLGYIGANQEVPLAHMAATFGVSVNRLCKDLRRMLSKGILPTGYLDLAEGKLFLTEMGYRRPEPREWAGEQSRSEQEDDLLRQIRQVNDEIPDKAMSAKIRRIEEISGKILAYQKTHPNREAQLRSFLNYYLPTTLKILRAYAQLEAQGIEGENISAAKARIEGMMDQVVAGFEKQLDRLFQDDAMDITSDVEVLENMLRKDGLSDDGMTMPM